MAAKKSYSVELSKAAEKTETSFQVRNEATLLKAGALQSAIFNSANFSYIATDAKGVIQIFSASRLLATRGGALWRRLFTTAPRDPRIRPVAGEAPFRVVLGPCVGDGVQTELRRQVVDRAVVRRLR